MTSCYRDGMEYVMDGSGKMFSQWLDRIARTDYRRMYEAGYDPKTEINAESDIKLLLSELTSAQLTMNNRKALFRKHQTELLRLFAGKSVNTTIPADCKIQGWAMLEGIRLSQKAEWTGQFGDDAASRMRVIQAQCNSSQSTCRELELVAG